MDYLVVFSKAYYYGGISFIFIVLFLGSFALIYRYLSSSNGMILMSISTFMIISFASDNVRNLGSAIR